MLAVFLWAAWGVGDLLWARLRATDAPAPSGGADPWLGLAMASALGMGLFIVLLQGLGMAGVLRPSATLALLLAALLCALWRIPAAWRRFRARPVAMPFIMATGSVTSVTPSWGKTNSIGAPLAFSRMAI